MPAGEQRAAVLGHHELAAHHQVHQQVRIAVQVDDDQLAPPADPGEPMPDQHALDCPQGRLQRRRGQNLDGLDRPVEHGCEQSAPDCLDLGELRHAVIIPLMNFPAGPWSARYLTVKPGTGGRHVPTGASWSDQKVPDHSIRRNLVVPEEGLEPLTRGL